jgi:hypothetical protein
MVHERSQGEKMISTFLRAGAFAASLAFSMASSAATVFNNGVPDLISGTQMSEFIVADDFTLASSNTLSNIRFWSVQNAISDYNGSVAWAFYSNASNQPGISLFSGLAAVAGVATGGSTGFGYNAYAYDIPISVTLSAGNYWLGLHNGPTSNTTALEMLWATTAVGQGTLGKYLDGTWVDTTNEHAFRLDGVSPVPEAQAPAMLLAGLVTLTMMGRFRRSKKSPPRTFSSLSE